MPRPLRIEYENAYYHVMNRGRGRQRLFHGDEYYQAFLHTLDEAHQRFGLQILCYCLMSNHYHLLVKTPEANLGRAMRHINGQYTQRYNRLKNIDGSLFRGRYKAIPVESDSYQLQLSRYIHRNPVEAKMLERLEDYVWSSYPNYISRIPTPDWLYMDEVYAQLAVKSRYRERYRAYVAMSIDEEISRNFGKNNQPSYLGSDKFRDWVYRQRKTDDKDISRKARKNFRPPIEAIIDLVSQQFSVERENIIQSKRGRVADNIPRWVVMYLAQNVCALTLREIAEIMGLKRTGSIPTTISKLKVRLRDDRKLKFLVDGIKRQYDT